MSEPDRPEPIYFHACAAVRAPGDIITTNATENRYWRDLVAKGANAANDALERERPEGKPSRRLCVFAAREAELAIGYARLQGIIDARLYEVDAAGEVHAGPMFLTSALSNRLAMPASERILKQIPEIVRAYWSEDAGWYGIEVLADALRVIRHVPLSADELKRAEFIAVTRGADDANQVSRRWPLEAAAPPLMGDWEDPGTAG